jgi:catechol 2,3-dioxygenase-like lactoylglutathione lyase family enzyme
MPLHGIDHVTLNASDLKKTCAFYAGLGFRVEPMSGRGVQGAWLYVGEQTFLHVAERPPQQSPTLLGQVDHFALEASGLAEMRRRLADAGLSFRENPVPELGHHQLVVIDPDGVKVELNFRRAEDLALSA